MLDKVDGGGHIIGQPKLDLKTNHRYVLTKRDRAKSGDGQPKSRTEQREPRKQQTKVKEYI